MNNLHNRLGHENGPKSTVHFHYAVTVSCTPMSVIISGIFLILIYADLQKRK